VHHQTTHIRPTQRSVEQRQRKLREKRRSANFVSTENTTSGDDGEEVRYSSEQEVQTKLEQLLKRSDQLTSDLEADCEDNNSTDVDTVSVSGNQKPKNGTSTEKFDTAVEATEVDNDVNLLTAKIKKLEMQLETVLQVNFKLEEENTQLKKLFSGTARLDH
jgi:dihydroxyacetone kinase DhaKLM complex PTS-EIIA-like component DhaM